MVLVIQSYFDLKSRKIPTVISFIGGAIGLIFSVYNKREIELLFWALIPGGICLLLGRITRESIGYGDGIIVGILGLFYDLEQVMSICLIAFGFAGISGLMLFIIFKKKGSYEIPFVPFLFLGWGIQLLG